MQVNKKIKQKMSLHSSSNSDKFSDSSKVTKHKMCLSNTKKGIGKIKNVDSLKEIKEEKKLNDLDEKIKFLKLELKSLAESSTPAAKSSDNSKHPKVNEANFDLKIEKKNSKENKIRQYDFKDESLNETHKPLKSDHGLKDLMNEEEKCHKTSCSLQLPQISEWLNTTIDQMDTKLCKSVVLKSTDKNDIQMIEEIQCKKSYSYPSNSQLTSKCTNVHITPPHNVERLLYKSFLMQNLEKYYSSSEEINEELTSSHSHKSKRPTNKPSRKPCKKRNWKFQNNKIFVPKKKKRYQRIMYSSSESEADVINLSNDPVNNTHLKSPDLFCSDIESLDWTEPFDLETNDDILSASEILDCDNTDHLYQENESFHDSVSSETLQIIEEVGRNMYKSSTTRSFGQEKHTVPESEKRVWECPICLEPSTGQEVVTTLCGHVFCKNCIQNFLKTNESCPTCRSNLFGKPLITLFNF